MVRKSGLGQSLSALRHALASLLAGRQRQGRGEHRRAL